MSAHTQGEWIARPDPSGTQSDWCIGLNDGVSPVDYIAVCHMRDAPLIAAAPKLLAALLALKERGHTQATWDIAERAIAKALGHE